MGNTAFHSEYICAGPLDVNVDNPNPTMLEKLLTKSYLNTMYRLKRII